MEDHIRNLVSMFDLPQITSQRTYITHHVTENIHQWNTHVYRGREDSRTISRRNSNTKEIISARRIEGRLNVCWNDLRRNSLSVYGWESCSIERVARKNIRDGGSRSRIEVRNVSRHQPIISHSSPPTDPSKSVEFCCLTCYGFSFVCQDSLRYGRIDDKDWIKSHVR